MVVVEDRKPARHTLRSVAARRLVIFQAERQRAVEVLHREVVAGAQRLVVRIEQRLFLRVLLLEHVVDDRHVDVEQRHQ